MQPLISVITPSFNQATFLSATIESVISQQNARFEYVVIDGGSTDNSVALIKSNERHLAYWLSERDEGQSHAIVKGVAKSKGEIICWLNSDDLLEPNALSKVSEHFKKFPDHQVLNGGCRLISEDGSPVIDSYTPDGIRRLTVPVRESIKNWPSLWFAQQSTFWRREIWDQVGGLDKNLHYAMDFDLWNKFAKVTEIHSVPDILASYRIHSSAKCSANMNEMYFELMSVIARHAGPELQTFWATFENVISNSFRKRKALEISLASIKSSRTFRLAKYLATLKDMLSFR